MRTYYSALAFILIVLFQSSCKKDKETLTCRVASWSSGSQTYFYTYDSRGFIERMSLSTTSNYLVYTQNGNILTRQAYDSTGAPTGSTVTSVVNSEGYYSMIPGSSDTTFLSYNADGQLLSVVRRNDTLINQTLLTYENGDMVRAVSLRSDSSVSSINTYEYYTERANNSNLLITFDLLDSRYGKPSRHFLKSSTSSNSSGDIDITTFYYTYDDNGNAVSLQLIRQPDNSISNIQFTYNCE